LSRRSSVPSLPSPIFNIPSSSYFPRESS
jgi:hypothetical protein